ncbi:MAG: S-layer homology domain-containing protein, partial [Oscillibacter sp.]|nr:S-layer homology domain-containing protein [Oscillibacter sp.]
MKKFLALALTLAMASSMLTAAVSAKDYSDRDEIRYLEAVEVLTAIGVLQGDNDGFRPEDTLKRSEAAKIICALNLTPKTAASLSADSAPFADVAASHWASGYIAEGVQSGILAGVGANRFDPDGKLTGFAYLKMLLVSLGYDAEAEGLVGSNWTVNVAKLAKKTGLTKGNEDFVGTRAVTREEAALYALNTLKAERV